MILYLVYKRIISLTCYKLACVIVVDHYSSFFVIILFVEWWHICVRIIIVIENSSYCIACVEFELQQILKNSEPFITETSYCQNGQYNSTNSLSRLQASVADTRVAITKCHNTTRVRITTTAAWTTSIDQHAHITQTDNSRSIQSLCSIYPSLIQ